MMTNPLFKIESMIFDFDGTLAEVRLDFAEMKLRLNALAESYSTELIAPAPRLPVLEWLSWLEVRLGPSDGDESGTFRERALAIIVEMEMEAARLGALFAFTRPMLRTLRESGVKTAIITRNCEPAVRLVFPDIADYCAAFLARENVPRPKPDPEHLLLAIRAAGGSPSTALMVGDHPIDIETGRAAGIRTAGVFSGNATRKDLLQSGADWVAMDCESLILMLRNEGLIT